MKSQNRPLALPVEMTGTPNPIGMVSAPWEAQEGLNQKDEVPKSWQFPPLARGPEKCTNVELN